MKKIKGDPVVAQRLTNPARIPEDAGLIPGLTQWIEDPALLWLWCRPAAVAPVRPLAREPPYAVDAALEKTKKEREKRNTHGEPQNLTFPTLDAPTSASAPLHRPLLPPWAEFQGY